MFNLGLAILIFCSLILILRISLLNSKDFASYKNLEHFQKISQNKSDSTIDDYEKLISRYFPKLNLLIGDKVFSRLVLPTILLSFSVTVLISPLLVKGVYSVILGLFISLAYSLRIFLHQLMSFRRELLMEIKQIFLNIRNSLSSGLSFDRALQNLNYNKKTLILKSLNNFIASNDTNLINKFPLWISSLANTLQINNLENLSQVVKLQLAFNNNQEEAFIEGAKVLSEKLDQNTKQKNLITLSLTTMDFMMAFFVALILIIIPNTLKGVSQIWLGSIEKTKTVLICGLILSLVYSVAVLICARRQN